MSSFQIDDEGHLILQKTKIRRSKQSSVDMVDRSTEFYANIPLADDSNITSSKLPLPAQLLQSRDDQQQESDDQSSYYTETMLSSDDQASEDFSRSRTPFSVDQTDQAPNYCHPFAEDHQDTESETSDYSTRRISPFTVDFMSIDATSSVFRKRKAIMPTNQTEVHTQATEFQAMAKPPASSSGREDAVLEIGASDSPFEPAIYQEDPVNQEIAREVSGDEYAITDKSNVQEYLVDVESQEANDIVGPITSSGLLTILDDEIDRQFTDKVFVSLEPDSADSSSLPLFDSDALNEQSGWTPGFCEATQDPADESITTKSDPAACTSPVDTDDVEEVGEKGTKEGLDMENSCASLETEVAEPTCINDEGATTPQTDSVRFTNLRDLQLSLPAQDRQTLRTYNEGPAERSEAEEESSPHPLNLLHNSMLKERRAPSSSDTSSESEPCSEAESPRTSPEVEEHTLGLDATDQLAEARVLINQTLHDFKIGLLQHFEGVIEQSTKALIPVRNSAAATLMARSLSAQMEEAIKLSISDARDYIVDTVDASKAEAIGYTLRMAQIANEQSTYNADALKKTLFGEMDNRFTVLEENLDNCRSDLSQQSSARTEARPKTIATEAPPSESLAALQILPEIIDQLKTLEISKKLEQYDAKAEAVSNLCTQLNETITAQQSLQSEILTNLCSILSQSTLQNNAINDLTTIVHPLTSLVKGISYDTNLIDAKLARNADILSSVTERTETLEEAAAKFGKIVGDAECKFKTATSKIERVAKTASGVDGSQVVERIEVLQEQMRRMQGQLDGMADAVAKQGSGSGRKIDDTSTAEDPNPVSEQNANSTCTPPPSNITAPTSIPSNPLIDPTPSPDSTTSPNTPPSTPTFTILASFRLPNQLITTAHPTNLPISESPTILSILSNLSTPWLKHLHDQGVVSANLELVAIWTSNATSTTRRCVDNDLAYRGWYRGVTMGGGGTSDAQQMLHFEFIDCLEKEGQGQGEEIEEPRSKKRRQGDGFVESEGGVEFSLDVWRVARQTKFGRVGGFGRLSG